MDSTQFKTQLHATRRVFDRLVESWDKLSEEQQDECVEELQFCSEELQMIQHNLNPKSGMSYPNFAMMLAMLALCAAIWANFIQEKLSWFR